MRLGSWGFLRVGGFAASRSVLFVISPARS
jgi:hypothetical protein